MSDLKDCSFCGSSDLVMMAEYDNNAKKLYHFVNCLDCGARGPLYVTEEGAIEFWDEGL